MASEPLPFIVGDILSQCAVVLCRTEGAINLGSISRSCANLGITDLRLVNPLCERDSEDARKFSHKSREFLFDAPVFTSVEDAVADCEIVIATSARPRLDKRETLDGPEDVPAFLATRPAKRFAILFGNERDGLNQEELKSAQAFLHIPTRGEYFSYNLSHAVAITLYVLSRPAIAMWPDNAKRPVPVKSGEATATEVEEEDKAQSQNEGKISETETNAPEKEPSVDDLDLSKATVSEGEAKAELEAEAEAKSDNTHSGIIQGLNDPDTLRRQRKQMHDEAKALKAMKQKRREEYMHTSQNRRDFLRNEVAQTRHEASPLATRAHIECLRRYWTGTAERFGYFKGNEGQRQKFEKVFGGLLTTMSLTQAHVNVIQGMLACFNTHAFGDKATDMTSSGRAPGLALNDPTPASAAPLRHSESQAESESESSLSLAVDSNSNSNSQPPDSNNQ